ncbi:acyl-CoA thioesterase-1 [Pedobacter sp. UYP30]|uniref:arylesterase n=1 Tax=Pedobacter sp. UYP30 TaxID=1756400 RepID=UPI0033995B23
MLRNHTPLLIVCFTLLLSCQNKQKQGDTENASQTKTIASVKNVNSSKDNMLFFGTSLTAGYGLDPTEAYPDLIQNKIDSLSLPYRVINGGLSGETSAAGLERIDWFLKKQPVAIFVLELGANDGLRGLPLKETKRNLQEIIDRVKAKNPNVKLVMAGMQMPPNLGKRYTEDFAAIFPALAEKNNMKLIPFLLDGVAGIPKLNQEDGIHPTAEGDKILAENVWMVLKEML